MVDTPTDLVVRRARLGVSEGLVDIRIHGGLIAGIAPQIDADAEAELDAGGALVSPTLVEPHIHFDKAFLLETAGPNAIGTLDEAIRLTRAAKAEYTIESVRERSERAIRMYVNNGVTVFRTHVDVDIDTGLTAMRGVLAARENSRKVADIQVVAFPHRATLKDAETNDLLVEALELGADVLGAFPDVERSEPNGRRHLDDMLQLAKSRNVPLDVHIDEGDEARYLEYLAARTIEKGMQGRVTASHACALSSCTPSYRHRIIGLLKESGIGVVVCPQTNLTMGGRLDNAAPRRGLAPAKELLQNGVLTAYGQDNMQDMFCPFGTGDSLQNGLLTALASHLTGEEEINEVFRMGTDYAAHVIGHPNYGLKPGNSADLTILDASSPLDAIRSNPKRLWVLKQGQIIVENTTQQV